MSGDWITVRGNDGRMRRVIDAPDLCGDGHPSVVTQLSLCPKCHAPNVPVFWCSAPGCRWAAPGGRHLETGCQPGRHRKPHFGVQFGD